MYDINGRLISTLADDTFDTGYHSFVWSRLDQSETKYQLVFISIVYKLMK